MKKNLLTALLYTIVTTILLGIIYPLTITGLAQLFAKEKANGQLIKKDGVITGSRFIAQPFTGAAYFHPRPSAAGANGYDASASSGSNLGPTSKALVDRITKDVNALQAEHPGEPVPIDLVTTSASGVDPDITPAGAEFQIARVARARHVSASEIENLVRQYTQPRQFRVFGELRVNVLELNLALDQRYPLNR